MVVCHRLTGRFAAIPGFRNQPRLPQDFVTLKNQLVVPTFAVETEIDRDPAPAFPADHRFGRGVSPDAQQRSEVIGHHGRGFAPVLPGEKPIPVAPAGTGISRHRSLSRQAQITDGDDALARAGAAWVGESVKLLHVAKRVMRLPLHPDAKTGLQLTLARFKWARRKPA